MPRSQEDWSDSDDGQGSFDEDGYTSVHLGIPSDEIDVEEDLRDPYVSRIGGTPTFFGYPYPSPDASKCKICKEPSELLVQMLCNLEESPFERALYVWGCSKASCQRKNGAIRVWRALRLDEKYAKKLERKKERKLREEAAKKANIGSKPSSNPFSSSGSNPFSATSTSGFGFGDAIMGFGSGQSTTNTTEEPAKLTPEKATPQDEEEESTSDEEDPVTVDKLSLQLDKISFGPSVNWNTMPQYKPIYLETESEHLPPPPKSKASSKHAVEPSGKAGGGGEWAKEMWEDSKNVDDIFVRFTARLDARPKQCVRYELNGVPLFYQADAVYRALHAIPPGTAVPVTGAAFVVSSSADKRTFSSASSPMIEKCSICGGPRRFECQLMPNLINVLKEPARSTAPDDQMEWGTCLVFTCENDCCMDVEAGKKRELKECWREEVVLVQWED